MAGGFYEDSGDAGSTAFADAIAAAEAAEASSSAASASASAASDSGTAAAASASAASASETAAASSASTAASAAEDAAEAALRVIWTSEGTDFDANLTHIQPKLVGTSKVCSIDTEANVGWVQGDSITLVNTGAGGDGKFAAKAGVTIFSPDGLLAGRATYSIITAIYKAGDNWYLTGDLG